jgi:hypothetical protein
MRRNNDVSHPTYAQKFYFQVTAKLSADDFFKFVSH